MGWTCGLKRETRSAHKSMFGKIIGKRALPRPCKSWVVRLILR